MTVKHFSLLLLAVIAFGAVTAQSQDELPIPVENDNQFPPDNQAEPDDGGIIEGSGIGAIQEPDEPMSTTTELAPVPLEEIQPTNQILLEKNADTSDGTSCPEKCLCSFEDDDFIIDCSGQQLTEFPLPLDSRTTKLRIQNNKLTELPKEISSLKQLKYLDASNNSIMDLASGSISELPELVQLDLRNNRLIEYPKDLKNSFGLIKLEELNLAGNDIRTPLESESLAMFTSLGKLTVPSGAYKKQLEDALCVSLKESLKTICVESCYDKEFNCENGSDNFDMENEMLGVIPGALVGDNEEDYVDPTVDSHNVNELQTEGKSIEIKKPEDNENAQENDKPSEGDTSSNAGEETVPGVVISENIDKEDFSPSTVNAQNVNEPQTEGEPTEIEKPQENTKTSEGDTMSNGANKTPNTDTKSASDYSLRSAVIQEPEETKETPESVNTVSSKISGQETASEKESEPSKSVVNVSQLNTSGDVKTTKNENDKSNTDEGYTVGAKTADTKTGGVDKSVIGIIVAGMVLVVAGITIKKNWSSIRRKFSSNSRTPNDRPTGNANGTTPEEVPLQDKSPV